AAQLSRARRAGRIVEWRSRQDCGMAGGAGRAPDTRAETRFMGKERRLEQVVMENLRDNIPAFAPCDTLPVMVRLREGEEQRLQAFEGICIARRGGGINETFTVRKISAGVGVERIFPLHAPLIAEIGLMRKGRVRPAKLDFPRRLGGNGAHL